MLRSKHSGNKKGESGGNSTGLSALTTSDPLGHFLHQLLQKQGQLKFRWSVPPGQSRPCNTARIWRPSQAEHKSNGAWVSVTHQGEVNLICLHPQCLHRGCSNRRLIGYVPLSLLRHSTDMNEVVVPVSPRVDPVSPRSNWKGAWQQRVPHAGQSNVVHNASLESCVPLPLTSLVIGKVDRCLANRALRE